MQHAFGAARGLRHPWLSVPSRRLTLGMTGIRDGTKNTETMQIHEELKLLSNAMFYGLTEKYEMRQRCLLKGRLVSRAQCHI